MERKCGVLLPVFSLPSKYGIGTFGREAYRFVDFLKRSGQSYWQILPLNPTSFGDSPYQSFSAFALNPYFVDLDLLKSDDLLSEEELVPFRIAYAESIDYGRLYQTRFKILRTAFHNARERGLLNARVFSSFQEEEAPWLSPYASFMVLKNRFGGKSFQGWPSPFKDCQSAEVKKAIEESADEVLFYEFLQYEALRQYRSLKHYANALGIKIIGDIPIYAALDSADVWGNPFEFQLAESKQPLWVAGVPPDYFSATGQLWGNPIYDYEKMEMDGFAWWRRRIRFSSKIYDVLRIDHFRGMADYWAVPSDAKTAEPGHWVAGPGRKLVDAIKEAAGPMSVIAEDLGVLSDAVKNLKAYAYWPGMKILQFAFDSNDWNDPFLPKNYEENCVAYLGTHDNQTTAGWLASHPELYPFMRAVLKTSPDRFFQALVDSLAYSRAYLTIYTMQDVLMLDDTARINYPSTLGGINWRFRLQKDYASQSSIDFLQRIVAISHRS